MPCLEGPTTRRTLLERLQNPEDRQARTNFCEVYLTVIYNYFRKNALAEADASEQTQNVASEALESLKNWDPTVGTFRGWLFTISQRKLWKFRDNNKKHERKLKDFWQEKKIDNNQKSHDGSADWDVDYYTRLAEIALNRTRDRIPEKKWQVFEAIVLRYLKTGEPLTLESINTCKSPAGLTERVATKLGLSQGTVQRYKSEAVTAFRTILKEIDPDDLGDDERQGPIQ